MSLRHSGEREIMLMIRKYLVVGRSAVGKDTVVRALCEKFGLKQIISYTTRPRRVGEGDTHKFITEDEAKQIKDKLAITHINGYEYFITKDQLTDGDIYIVDPKGAKEIRALSDQIIQYHVFNIWLPEEVRQERIAARGDDPAVAAARCADENAMFSEFESDKSNWDNSVKNLDLTTTIDRLSHIIQAHNNELLDEIQRCITAEDDEDTSIFDTDLFKLIDEWPLDIDE